MLEMDMHLTISVGNIMSDYCLMFHLTQTITTVNSSVITIVCVVQQPIKIIKIVYKMHYNYNIILVV